MRSLDDVVIFFKENPKCAIDLLDFESYSGYLPITPATAGTVKAVHITKEDISYDIDPGDGVLLTGISEQLVFDNMEDATAHIRKELNTSLDTIRCTVNSFSVSSSEAKIA